MALGNHDSIDDLRAYGLVERDARRKELPYYRIDDTTIVLDSSSGLINAVQMNFPQGKPAESRESRSGFLPLSYPQLWKQRHGQAVSPE